MPCDRCHLPLSVQVSLGACWLRNSTKDIFSVHLWKYWQQWHRHAPRCYGCCFNKSLFIGSDLNEGGDLERESLKLSSRPTVGQFLAPDRWRNRGPGLPGIRQTPGLHEGPVPCPHPMPALLAAGSSGLRLQGRSQSCIFGECFTLGNGPGILKERPPPSSAKASLSCFRKEVPRKERQQSGSLFRPPEPAFSSSGSQGDRQGPRWTVRSPQPHLGEAKAGVGDGPIGSLITVIRKSLWGLPYETQGSCEGCILGGREGLSCDKKGSAPPWNQKRKAQGAPKAAGPAHTTGLRSACSQGSA